MKFLLSRYVDRDTWDVADDTEFVGCVRRSGELVDRQAVADPSTGAVVRARDCVPEVVEGPRRDATAYLAEYYLVDCESRERALHLAALVAGASRGTVEVRPVMTSTGLEM